MAKSHEDILLECDARLLEGLRQMDTEVLAELTHPDLVFTNEFGQTSYKAAEVPFHKEAFRYSLIEVLRREVALFLSVGIVVSEERRIFESGGMMTESVLVISRIWKFDGCFWKLVSATSQFRD